MRNTVDMKLVRSRLRAGKYRKGCSCRFIVLPNDMGVKMYSSQQKRDFSMSNQKLAAKHGLAPKVFNKLDLARAIRDVRFGYLTEKVRVYPHIEIPDEIYDELDKEFRKIGMIMYDLHSHNVGLTKNGKYICVDFDIIYSSKDL